MAVMQPAEQLAPPRPFLIDRAAYHRMGKAGVFDGRRVQLVYGTVIDMSPMGIPHRVAIRVLNRYFVEQAPDRWDVMVQLPLELSDDSEPEPDFAFVPRLKKGDDPAENPEAALVIEVSDSSLKFDLEVKARLYAEAGIREYWVLDLAAQSTVVHRAPRGSRYTKSKRVPWTRACASSEIPELSVRFVDVLPL